MLSVPTPGQSEASAGMVARSMPNATSARTIASYAGRGSSRRPRFPPLPLCLLNTVSPS